LTFRLTADYAPRVGTITGLDNWTGLDYWTTGLDYWTHPNMQNTS